MRIYLFTLLMTISLGFSVTNGWSQADTHHLLLKLVHKDAENAYNSTFQRVNMLLANHKTINSVCFVENENAFIVKASSVADITSIKQKLGDQVILQEIKSIQYQNLLRQQAAFRLSKKQGAVLNDPTYPTFQSSGNEALDKTRYQKAIEKWLQNNPEKFNHLIQNRN